MRTKKGVVILGEEEMDMQKLQELMEEYSKTLAKHAKRALNEVKGKIDNIVDDISEEFGEETINKVQHRIKTAHSAAEKAIFYSYESLDELTDVLGFRIICLFQEDIENVCRAIDREFAVKKTKDYLHDPKSIDEGGYCGAIHKKIDVQCSYHGVKVIVPLEIQVTDVIAHAIWERDHAQDYKNKKRTVNKDRRTQIIEKMAALEKLTGRNRENK